MAEDNAMTEEKKNGHRGRIKSRVNPKMVEELRNAFADNTGEIPDLPTFSAERRHI
jgi:hypothetical protein